MLQMQSDNAADAKRVQNAALHPKINSLKKSGIALTVVDSPEATKPCHLKLQSYSKRRGMGRQPFCKGWNMPTHRQRFRCGVLKKSTQNACPQTFQL